jgi:hypothetical protein
MCLPHARGSMAHGALPATVYCTAQKYIVKETRGERDDFDRPRYPPILKSTST